ncbi:MAG: hypothetical protein JNM78_01905 [Cyclobacteriaceae bacterium]|nr:hypothetical protein [Cyclobacteriaceae bacterium]
MKFFKLLVLVLLSVAAYSQSASTHVYSSDKDSKITYKNSDGFNSFNIEIRGTVEVTDDDKDIKSMSSDGYLEITKTSFGSRRTIKISTEGKLIKREYFEGRSAVNYEPEGRKWLAEILPEVVRTTTIAAESRVNRFYAKGGTQGVLNEIDQMKSDYIKSHYANLLMKKPVQEKDYALIISKISDNIDSDHYLSQFLQNNLSKFLQNKEATQSLFTATNRLGSDHYKTQVIKEALSDQSASIENVKIILASSSRMGSDHYKTEVLTSLMRQSNLTDPIMIEIINSSKSVNSDHYRTEILTKALDRKLSPESYQKAIEAVKDISSDHYITQVIKELLRNPIDEQSLTNLLLVTASIESDHYRTEVLTSLLKKQELKEAQFKKLVEYCDSMGSDHYKSQTLRTALSTPQMTDGKMIAIIKAASELHSDHYMTEVLVEAAPYVKSASNGVKDAYRSAAKNINSETYYGRTMRAMNN